ncbi:hypothetical protein, partial [Pseudomonas viridiflava]|uniref:hypothetical protein n=1 Tax=Pseudomonas viridiflava TaxID=33069 RepID=UPI001981FDBC
GRAFGEQKLAIGKIGHGRASYKSQKVIQASDGSRGKRRSLSECRLIHMVDRSPCGRLRSN